MTSIVKLEGVSVRYRRSKRLALNNLTVEFKTGVEVLLGPNGAGKSTLMKLITFLANSESGKISIFGDSWPSKPALQRETLKRVGYLPQNFGFPRNFTVAEFVEYACWLKAIPASDCKPAALQALDSVDLASKANLKMAELSGGMVRRAGFAAATAHKPEIVLLDEPTAGLDPIQREFLRERVRDLGTQACVLVSTHLTQDAEEVADRVHVLHEGGIRFSGTVSSLNLKSARERPQSLEQGYFAVIAEVGQSGISQ